MKMLVENPARSVKNNLAIFIWILMQFRNLLDIILAHKTFQGK